MRTCLISIDLQRAFLDDPALEPAAGSVLAGAAAWLERFRDGGLPVVHVRTTLPRDGGSALPHWDERRRLDFAPGAAGWRFAREAEPREGEGIVEKTRYSGFESGSLRDLLGELGVQEVVVIGIHLHGCVRSTALDASAAGLRVDIGVDATASNDPAHAAATRRWMGARGFRFRALDDGEATRTPEVGQPAAAAARAAAGFLAWSAEPTERRVALLEPLARLLRGESDRLAELMAREVGKPMQEGLAEIGYAIDLVEQSLARVSDERLVTPDGEARRAPHGPVLLVTPWNNPIAIPIGKIVPALALGNTVVWKPSPLAGDASDALHDLIGGLSLPNGALERVDGGAREVESLVAGGCIRAVSLTGSLEAGRALQHLCAARMIPLQAELGGNNAAIVCGDADIERAAGEIATAAFSFAGQRCTATRRAIVLREAYEAFVEALRARLEDLRPGDPRFEATGFGPVVSPGAAVRIERTLARAAAEGAAVWRPRWAGEDSFAEMRGAHPFVAPALVEDAPPRSEVVGEETFGPVLVLIPAATLDAAIASANEVPQGLAASIHTRSPEAIARFTRDVRAGVLEVNRSTAGASASLPFGGVGLSSVGAPEHGPGDVEFYTRWQAIYTRESVAGRAASPEGRAAGAPA